MATIALDSVTGGNKINSVEATSALALSGTSSGLAAGTLVSIFIDSATTPVAYSVLNADGSWHATFDATGLAEGVHAIKASAAAVTSTQNVTVDTLDPVMTIAAADPALSSAGTVHYNVSFGEAPVSVATANSASQRPAPSWAPRSRM